MLTRFFSLIFITSTLMACSSAPSDSVSVSGSSTVLPVVSRAADNYSARLGRSVIVNSGGSGAGFSQFAQGLTDIGMMSRDVTESERAQYPDLKFTPIAIGRDAVLPVVSSEIYAAGVTALSLSQIAQIYRGEITNWNALGGPDREILVIDKEASRGTRHIFMQSVMGNAQAEALGADLVLGSNNEEQTALTQSDSAIGMLSMAWLNADVKGVALVRGNETVNANLDSIAAGQYPITRDLLIIVRSDMKPAAQDFVDFLLAPDGQAAVQAAGYIPISRPPT